MMNSKARKFLRRFAIALAVLAGIALVVLVAMVSSARVEMTEGGAHRRLMLPVGVGAIGISLYTGTGENVSIPGFLAGPVVERKEGGGWDAAWYCEDRVGRTSGEGAILRIGCAGSTHEFDVETAPTAAAVGPMPDRLVVLSDLEGNITFLEAALRKLEVVGEAGNWTYGEGHLVILGDSVDRGRDVFATLWRLHDLANQAAAAGGAVHYVLGNHEQYLLRGNTSRAHPEDRYALRQLGGPVHAYASGTVLGDWLHDQPVMLKLGQVLFTHAGISQQVADSGLTVGQLNAAMRDYWRADPGEVAHSPALDAVIGRTGVTQYRGYFRDMEGFYAQARQDEVAQWLQRFDASQVVVAHTIVEGVKPLYQGLVYAVDVNHDEARPQVLVYEGGTPRVVDIGILRGVGKEEAVRTREFSLFDAGDRRLLREMYAGFHRISDIPHPY